LETLRIWNAIPGVTDFIRRFIRTKQWFYLRYWHV